MADEITTNATPATETSATVAAPVEKKKRAPKGSKTATPAVAAGVATPTKARTPRKVSVGAVAEPVAAVKSPVKSTPAKKAPKPAVKAPKVSVAKVDDFADLIQLEAENKKLRVALAAKLRAENADLRKRLGTK